MQLSSEATGEDGTVAHDIQEEGEITPVHAIPAATSINAPDVAPAAETALMYPSEAVRHTGSDVVGPGEAVPEPVEGASTHSGRHGRLRRILDKFGLPQCMHAGFGDTSQPPLFAVGALPCSPVAVCEDVFWQWGVETRGRACSQFSLEAACRPAFCSLVLPIRPATICHNFNLGWTMLQRQLYSLLRTK